jgi:crotonobetainyl-CoA:carnitine CoA-transferase CaiB-like acyl-CoA transferase
VSSDGDDPVLDVCAGLRVVDLSQGMAGPLATMVLADHGADVVKVEPPTGDLARGEPGFLMWNRGKRSVVLDLGVEADRAHARTLARTADVVVASARPGVLERAGLGYDTIAAANPSVVHASVTGFGRDDPRSRRRTYEGVVAATCGRMVGLDPLSGAIPHQDRAAPIYTAAPIASYGASQLLLHGILAALLVRGRTGRGQRVETSLLAGESAFLMRQDMGRGGPDRVGLPDTPRPLHRGIVMCFLTAECADGRYIQMCARQDHHFRNWMATLDMADVFDDPRYARAPLGIATVEEVVALEDRIRARMRTRTRAEWMDAFVAADVGADPFLEPAEFLAFPEMVDNDRVVDVVDPVVGPTRQVGPLALLAETPARIGRPAPAPGADTDAVLADAAGRVVPTPVGTAAARGPHALSGVTIVELAYYVAAPLASTLLAEMGARVIKVEPLDGDPARRTGLQNAKFLVGKESIALDLKTDAGREVLARLIGRADALLHSFRRGVPERLGYGVDAALAINPRLVYVYGASYGSRGPWSTRPAFHSTPNALSGGGFAQAGWGNPPVDDSYPDPGSGIATATALLLGLLARERTGRGQYVETSMISSAGYIHGDDLVLYDGRPPPRRSDRGQHGLHALYRLYPCRDDWLFVAAWRDDEWAALAGALDHPEWLRDERFATATGRAAHDDELTALVGEALAVRTAAEWEDALTAADVAAARASAVPLEEWFEREGLLLAEDHPVFGPFWRAPAKVHLSEHPPRMAPVCGLGEHSRNVLAEFGYTDDTIAHLIAAGVVVDGARTGVLEATAPVPAAAAGTGSAAGTASR